MDFHRLIVEHRPKLTGIREGMFGRIFPGLPLLQVALEEVLAIGAEQGVMDVAAAGPGQGLQDNPRIPAGFAFFGQFIAHDITSDRTPSRLTKNSTVTSAHPAWIWSASMAQGRLVKLICSMLTIQISF